MYPRVDSVLPKITASFLDKTILSDGVSRHNAVRTNDCRHSGSVAKKRVKNNFGKLPINLLIGFQCLPLF